MEEVGAIHKFHDEDYVRDWAGRFDPTGPRLDLFDMILAELGDLPGAHVVELGLGPGYLARHLLSARADISYEGVDFSTEMFAIARETLGELASRVTFNRADLLESAWPDALSARPAAIVSTWSLHDLGGRAAIAHVYARCHATLRPGGVLVNGDFIKPDGAPQPYEAGRFEIDKHLDDLRAAGFAKPRCTGTFEINLDTPTSAHNYACFVARK